MEPSYPEIFSKEVCTHLVYVLKKLRKRVPVKVRKGAESYYGNPGILGQAIERLKNEIKAMTTKQIESIVYNAHSKESRALAAWYEEELEGDRRKKSKEEAIKRRYGALSKLRAIEVKIIEDYIDLYKSKK
jgi:hypothetical protein